MKRTAAVLFALVSTTFAALPVACSSPSESAATAQDGAPVISLGDGGFVDAPDFDGHKPRVDGGFVGPGGTVLRDDRFVTDVVSFTPGQCAGFGAPDMPAIVEGPPVGAGDLKGSFDVVSLGLGGEIVVSFGPNAIVDGPGPDFIVFENAFFAAGNPEQPAADLAEVSVSEDGTTWKTFTCEPGAKAPFAGCSGWRPVYSAPGNAISPVDVAKAGGEAFDLADVGLKSAKLVRIKDLGRGSCDVVPKPNNAGYDLDAVAIVNARLP